MEDAPKASSRPEEQVVAVTADAVGSPAPAEKELPVMMLAPEKVVEEEEAELEDQKLQVHGQSVSFKEEKTIVSNLPEPERKALDELKQLVREALENRELRKEPVVEKTVQVVAAETEGTQMGDDHEDDGARTVEAIEETIVAVALEETKADDGSSLSLWGVPLMADERSDVILSKFLRARDFNVEGAFSMIKDTIRWRNEFGIEELLVEDLGFGDELDKVVFMHGHDKEGHPVCYNVYGEFRDNELYRKAFSDEEKRAKFLRWRIQFLERSIRKLDFRPGGVSTILQVNDLKDFPGLSKRELRQATGQALQVLQDNYPELLAKQVFINVPWWYLAFYKMISPFMTQRTKSKFVFAGPSKTPDTLSRCIAAERVPVQYGGLSKDGEFGIADAVTEIILKPASKQTIEFPITEACLLTWEVRVVGWEVRYAAEFTPRAAESYTVIIQKPRKVAAGEEPVICNSFKAGEPGKVVITIDNPTTKKKKLLYRSKVEPISCA